MKPKLASVRCLAILAIVGLVGVPAALGQTVRLVVNKHLMIVQSGDPYAPVPELTLTSNGFRRIADYGSFTLYAGPASNLGSAQKQLSDQGYDSVVPSELDFVNLAGGHRVNADTGSVTPPYPSAAFSKSGSRGLYLIALTGYPVQSWLDELEEAGVSFIEPLPPSSYIVQGNRQVIEGLTTNTSFVRGAFPMIPAMKAEPVATGPAVKTTFRNVLVEAYESTLADSIESYLSSVAEPASVVTVTSRDGPRVRYTARLSDLDINTLASFESVYAIQPTGEAAPSSERQAWLVANPTIGGGGELSLPTTASSYGTWLAGQCVGSLCISDFSNTKVAMVDTGFDNLALGLHPDFTNGGSSTVITSYGSTVFNQTTEPNVDNYTHGTVSTSVLTAWEPITATRKDSQGYRYAYGLAPTVATAVDKFFAADGSSYAGGNSDTYTRLTNALTALATWSPNIINHSWNSGGSGADYCGYENISQLLDIHTRTNSALHVVAAGNSNEANCGTVRAPGTAKNAITAGATENYTLGATNGWSNSSGYTFNSDPTDDYVGTCAYNYFPSAQDGRNISSFSARKATNSLVKPELVAPGLRVTGPLSRASTWEVCTKPGLDGTCNGIFCNKNIATGDGIRYGFSAGTSFAAPAVSGAAAVLRKWYANISGNPSANPSPALTKAMLINGGRDIYGGVVRQISQDGANPAGTAFLHVADQYQGFGMLSFAGLLDGGTNHFWADQPVQLNYPVPNWVAYPAVVDGAKPIRVTLVYTDRYSTNVGGTGGLTYKAVNNLNLKVCDRNLVTCFRGNNWAGDGTTQATSLTQDYNDDTNVVEEVVIPQGWFSTGQQLFVHVDARSLAGDGIDPNGSTLRQDFAIFGTNIH